MWKRNRRGCKVLPLLRRDRRAAAPSPTSAGGSTAAATPSTGTAAGATDGKCSTAAASGAQSLKHSATPEQNERLNKNKKLCLAGIIVPIVIMVIEIIVSIVVAISALNFARKQIEDYAQDPDGYANRVQQDIENEVEDYFQKEYGIDIKDYEQQK